MSWEPQPTAHQNGAVFKSNVPPMVEEAIDVVAEETATEDDSHNDQRSASAQ